ncbi:hypothetical protein NLJ89_g5343 [Agrocybe chaxingu]|uniref:FAD-binding domain-containing protein n=1 Tax=Agrocybe chaxingu TaxID=84603 RepID=A0A9W8K0Z7_9AGAR|nr:hypothetical protein NLJ89_g5343 [Agrocybe chaxingu]
MLLTGLASAYTLRRAGHEVVLLEKGDGKARSTGGLRSPPNLTKLLNQWGLGPTLDHIARQCTRINFYAGESGDTIGSMVIHEDFIKDLVAGFMFVQHGKLQSLLLELAEQEGVSFRYNTRVLGADPDSASVVLETGERLYGDVIIGADGHGSVIRSSLEHEVNLLDQENHLILAFTIPVDQLRADEDLRPLTNPSTWAFWLGDGYVVHANVLNEGRDYTVTIVHNYAGPVRECDEDWRSQSNITEFGIDFTQLDSRAKKLLDLASNVSSRVVRTRGQLDSLVSETSKIILVGEAAHSLVPGGHHCTALALEDAQTLGCLFGRIQNKNQVSRLVTAYDEIRLPRSNFALQYDAHHQAMLKASPGPMREQRDALLRQTLIQDEDEHMEEATFMKVWGNEFVLFAHDATEKVEDWWGQYGSLIVQCPNRHSIVPNVEISVLKDTNQTRARVN